VVYARTVITRRLFLRVVTSGAASAALPTLTTACSSSSPPSGPVVTAPPGSFFTDAEWRALNALADAVLPPDDLPGGSALGVATYIDTLMRAFDSNPPLIHAGGPFSGRFPFPNAVGGGASTVFPPESFTQFLPLSRVADRAWRLRLFGSANVPGGGPNDALAGPVVGLRDLMKQGLAAAMAASTAPIETLDPTSLGNLFGTLAMSFAQPFAELVVEGALAAPEYGGNADLAGWRMVHFDGDVQPLGFSVFDGAANTYVERLPVSTADPGPDVDPMDDATRAKLTLYTNLLNGRVA
jgi:hypothetical protein